MKIIFFTQNLIMLPIIIFFVFFLAMFIPISAKAEEPCPVVVIDPGHGGENHGGLYENYIEKDMDLIVANAMYEELSKYQGITVYMTRTADVDLSLVERAEYAKSVGANMFVCLHFNLSENHTLFGSEAWVSAFGENYAKGYSIANEFLNEFDTLGIYRRGIKTKLNNKGTDYYGVIRQCTEFNIPSVIVEHCHLDHLNDADFPNSTDKLITFGKMDATAVAKYYRLSSQELGVDYSNYSPIEVEVPSFVVKPDNTPPEICTIELIDANYETGEVSVHLHAEDMNGTSMLYYDYSLDGGNTFSGLNPFDTGTGDIDISLSIPNGVKPELCVRAYNRFDMDSTSNMLSLDTFNYSNTSDTLEESNSDERDVQTFKEISINQNRKSDNDNGKNSFVYKILLAALIISSILLIAFIIMMFYLMKCRKNIRKRHKEKK